ncbi:hypothetical protein ACFWFQ_10910 [Nocardia salmonicida]|uniref:hypothetical protein n=1 Tax=Nocardia salmonicida TaxID=53431 RepID=UPI003656604D
MSETNLWRSVALSNRLAERLIADDELAARLDHARLDTVVVGIERLDGSGIGAHHLDPTVLAAVLSPRLPRTRLSVAAANHREHPWNLARAVASLQTVAPRGSGLVLGARDHTVAEGEPGARAWEVRGLSRPVDIGIAATLDAGVIARNLWQDYAFDAVVADRSTGVYIDTARVRATRHHGVYDVAGPLPVPTRGRPVLSLFAPDVASAGVIIPSAFDSVTTSKGLATADSAGELFGTHPLIVHTHDPDDIDRITETVRRGAHRIRGVQVGADDDTLEVVLDAFAAR